MKIVVIAITRGAKVLAERIASNLPGCFVDSRDQSVFSKIDESWKKGYDAIICIMASGIVVRAIASLCVDKKKDPCVLVLDEKGKFVISLLSGHLGGGNELSLRIASFLNAQAVITTASDVTGHIALDLFAKKNSLLVQNSLKLTEKSAKLINSGSLRVYSEHPFAETPKDFILVNKVDSADIIISDKVFSKSEALILRPNALAVGLGCNRGTGGEEFKEAVTELFVENHLNSDSVCAFASIDLKQDEQGMLEYAANRKTQIKFFNKDQLNSVEGVSSSAAVLKATGAKGVAEPAACLAAKTISGHGVLLLRKRKWKNVTAAVAVKRIVLLV